MSSLGDTLKTISKHTETIAIIIAGLAAIGVGYTSYVAGLWDGESLEKYSKATSALTDANTTYLSIGQRNDEDSDAEIATAQAQYDTEHKEAAALTEEADTANKKGDYMQLLSVYFSVVLFLTSLMTVVRRTTNKIAVILIGTGVLLICTILAITAGMPS